MDLDQRVDKTARLRSGSRDGLRNAAGRAATSPIVHVCDHAVGSDVERVRRRDEGASGVVGQT